MKVSWCEKLKGQLSMLSGCLAACGLLLSPVLNQHIFAQSPPVPGQSEPVLVTPKPGSVPLFPSFSPNPTVRELSSARIFEEPLVPMWGTPSAAENRALADALLAFAARQRTDDFSALTGFLQAPVSYCWYPAVAYALGWEYYHTGYYSKAIVTWEDAWWWCKDVPGGPAKVLADRTAGELARMHSRIGGFTRLGEILDEVKERKLDGSATERIAAAKQALWLMHHRPEISFRCGPLALNSILNHTRERKGAERQVLESASTQQGFSLEQVHKLSRDLNMGLQMARRPRGAEIILPCVVHWNVGHYAAITQREGDRFLVVDPTFGNSHWISREALEAEASGAFLVPAGQLPRNWGTVDDTEARTVWGKGVTQGSDANHTTPRDLKANPDCGSVGMAVYNFHLMLVSLNIEDTPISFQPPRGPRIELTLTYNHREANQPSGFSYSNFGQKWTCNWISYIKDNGTNTPADVEHYVGGGGTEIYTGFNTNTQAFDAHWRTQSILKRTSTNSYELTYSDGSRLVFTNIDGTVGNTRKVFLTEVIDPTGYTNRVEYDAGMRIVAVKDVAAGTNQLTFSYNGNGMLGSTYSITRVTDRYQRIVDFDYGNTFYSQLHSITDVIGLTSSFTYNGDFINKLTTPYGSTAFAYGEDSRTRWLEATDPQGGVSRVEYNERTDIGIPTADPGPVVPQGMFTRNYILHARNTFYWDKKALREAPGDYSKARLYHWLHSENFASAVGVLESYKEPLENRVWFNYPGQTNDFSATVIGTNNLPSAIGRVLDDGTTQLWQYQRNFLGQITNSVDPVGREFSYIYATNGVDLLEVRQTRGTNDELLATFTWNAQHLPLTIGDAARQTNRFAYNAFGQVTYITNALNEITAFSYDGTGRLSSVDGPLAGGSDTVSFTYDAYDRVFTVTDVDGFVVTNYYDKLDRITTNAFPDGTKEITTYTNLDVSAFTDRESRVTRWTFDSLRQLREIHEATNWVTRLEWCKCGDLESVTDPLGRMTHWLYDMQGRVTAKVYPDKSLEQYAYENTTSRLKSFTNERGQMRTFAYFDDDRLRQIQYANTNVTPTVVLGYSANYPRLVSMVDGTGTTVFDYHSVTTNATLGAGRLKSINGPISNDTLEYDYDELGRLKREQIHNAAIGAANLYGDHFYQNNWKYDALGRITQVTNTLGPVTLVGGNPYLDLGTFTYGYHGASSRLASIGYPNGYTATLTYTNVTSDFRLKEIAYSTGTKFIYDYTPTGKITNWVQQLEGATPKEFRLNHDPIDQLSATTVMVSGATNKTYTYTYDLAGNRSQEKIDSTAVNAWHNPLNQLIGKDAGTTVTNRTYEWDEEDRLRAIVEGNNRTEFFYNGLGQVGRILEKTGATTNLNRYLTWSGDELAQECNVNNNAYYKWYYKDGYVDIYWANQGSTFYFMRDHLGSLWEVKRAYDGLLARQNAYDPYGRRTATVDLFGASSTPPHDGPEVGFTGLFTLKSQGLVMAKHRVYDPDLGRWLSRDPIGEAGGLNLYRYANNDPVNWTDLDGLCPTPTQKPGRPMNSAGGGGGIRPPRPPKVASSASPADGEGGGPYRSIRGHHVHAQNAFLRHPNYNLHDAFAISDRALEAYGVRHKEIMPIQRRLFIELGRSGLPNNLTQHSRVAYKSLVEVGIPPQVAKQWVIESQRQLIQRGVFEPTRIPWVTK